MKKPRKSKNTRSGFLNLFLRHLQRRRSRMIRPFGTAFLVCRSHGSAKSSEHTIRGTSRHESIRLTMRQDKGASSHGNTIHPGVTGLTQIYPDFGRFQRQDKGASSHGNTIHPGVTGLTQIYPDFGRFQRQDRGVICEDTTLNSSTSCLTQIVDKGDAHYQASRYNNRFPTNPPGLRINLRKRG